jgi:hypothetical protein
MTRAMITTKTINQMPGIRSGTKYSVGPEHHGRYAKANCTFGSNNKRHQELGHATILQTSQKEDKRIKLENPAPPTPTKQEIIKLERARRGANPTCLHFKVEKEVREYLYPDHHFSAHCDDYVKAMIHSMKKKPLKEILNVFMPRRAY